MGYPFLGEDCHFEYTDAERPSGSKPMIRRMLDKLDCKICECLFRLYDVLKCWDPLQHESDAITILQSVDAPLNDEKYIRWCRNQNFRLASAYARASENKWGDWPWPLDTMADESTPSDVSRDIAARLVTRLLIAGCVTQCSTPISCFSPLTAAPIPKVCGKALSAQLPCTTCVTLNSYCNTYWST